MTTERITWSVSQSAVTIRANGQTYVIKDKNGDKHVSSSEIQEALKGKDLDKASDKLLDLFSQLGESKNTQGRSLATIKEDFRGLSKDNNIVKSVRERRAAEKTAKEEKARVLQARYEKLESKIRLFKQAVSEYKQQQQQQRDQMNFMRSMMSSMSMMSPMNMILQNPFGGMMGANGSLIPYTTMVPGFNMGSPIFGGGVPSFGGTISKSELTELQNTLNKEIREFKDDLRAAGITEDELLKGEVNKIKVDISPVDEVVFEEIQKQDQNENTETVDTTEDNATNKGRTSEKASSKKPQTTVNQKEIEEIADNLHTEIEANYWCDHDKLKENLRKINKDNVLEVLQEYDAINNGADKDLFEAIVDEWMTKPRKRKDLKLVLDAFLERIEQDGLKEKYSKEVKALKQKYKMEYRAAHLWCDEQGVADKFHDLYKKIKAEQKGSDDSED